MKTSVDKKLKIKQSLAKTRDRRKSQDCKIYKLKIDISHANKIQKQFLHKIFIEAKWFYNFILQQNDIFNSYSLTKSKEVSVKKIDIYENRKLEFLSSQMKQSL